MNQGVETAEEPRQIVLSGASGLLARAATPLLTARGGHVLRLVRHAPASPDEIGWNPMRGFQSDQEARLEGLDALVHLAGENVADGRWTDEKKRAIRESRVVGTRLLAEALARRQRKPRVMVCASAIGLYSDRGAEWQSETSPAGHGFLSQVCREWEEAARPAVEAGIRVVHLRIGLVLTPEGGALARMLPLFRMGVGARLGHGRQYMSWIAIEDMANVIAHAIECPSLSGAVNAVAPNPVTNEEFTRTLAGILHRPVAPPAPAFALRFLWGEMADALLLASIRCEPRRLLESGFHFRFSDLEPTLRHMLSPGDPGAAH